MIALREAATATPIALLSQLRAVSHTGVLLNDNDNYNYPLPAIDSTVAESVVGVDSVVLLLVTVVAGEIAVAVASADGVVATAVAGRSSTTKEATPTISSPCCFSYCCGADAMAISVPVPVALSREVSRGCGK